MSAIRRIALAGSIGAFVAVFVPYQVRPEVLVGAEAGALVRLNDACGQATSCAPLRNYICSTYRSDYQHYVCNSGCGSNGT